MGRKHRDKPYKHWDPVEEEDEDPIWDDEESIDDLEFAKKETTVRQSKLNTSNVTITNTTKVSENRGRRPS